MYSVRTRVHLRLVVVRQYWRSAAQAAPGKYPVLSSESKSDHELEIQPRTRSTWLRPAWGSRIDINLADTNYTLRYSN
jgi:hypothetical protein